MGECISEQLEVLERPITPCRLHFPVNHLRCVHCSSVDQPDSEGQVQASGAQERHNRVLGHLESLEAHITLPDILKLCALAVHEAHWVYQAARTVALAMDQAMLGECVQHLDGGLLYNFLHFGEKLDF